MYIVLLNVLFVAISKTTFDYLSVLFLRTISDIFSYNYSYLLWLCVTFTLRPTCYSRSVPKSTVPY